MSKPRIFQHNVGGYTVTESIAALHPEEYTEVQVVPLDAIVIPRDELPEVRPATEDQRASARPLVLTRRGDALHRYITNDDTVESFRAKAAMYLALAEHLREHPPVDEEQVASLFEVLTEEWFPGDDGERASTLARRLVERGVRLEQA